MGTRSLTHFENGGRGSATLLTMYRQYDGYPESHGVELAEILQQYTLTNGVRHHDTELKFANRMEELTALALCEFKQQNPRGNIYVHTPNCKDVCEEYTYFVYVNSDDIIRIQMRDYDYQIKFDDTVDEFIKTFKK
jgi:hypothetical protein